MKDDTNDEELGPEELAALEDDAGLARLVRRALDDPPTTETPAGGAGGSGRGPARDAAAGAAGGSERLVRGIQKRLRERSRGKFYGDGWSVARSRTPLALVAVTMLVLAAVVWLALGPTGVTP